MPRKKKDHVEKKEKPIKNDIEKGQPVINIGLVGHVDHGKTTLLESLSGKWADTHSEEVKRGITIRLGYADVIFRKCKKCNLYTTTKTCPECKETAEPVRKVSFVDAPGHESLMATMLAGATMMDGALLLIAANEDCPQPQTREHLMALEIIGMKNIIIIQNKIDLVDEKIAMKNYEDIQKFIKGTKFEKAPIIPLSAQHKVGMTHLIEAIEDEIKTPKRDATKDPLMFVARSFDVNKPGTQPEKLAGGILGGALVQGKLKVGQEIEIKPGYEKEERNQKIRYPLKTKITGLKTGGYDVKELLPGGSIGVLTALDPSVVNSDKLTGSVVGLQGKLPDVLYTIKLKATLLKRVVGVKEAVEVEPIKMGEPLMLNVNSTATVGMVNKLQKGSVFANLKIPVCAEIGSRVTISRRIGNRFRLIGYGIIEKE